MATRAHRRRQRLRSLALAAVVLFAAMPAAALSGATCPVLRDVEHEVPATGPLGDAIDAVCKVEVGFETSFDPGDGSPLVERRHAGAVDAPMLLDIGGTPAPELIATASLVAPSGARLTVTPAPGAPELMRAALVATLTQSGENDDSIAVRLDALASFVPQRVEVSFQTTMESAHVTIATAGAGDSLSVDASGPGRSLVGADHRSVAVSMAPVPALAQIRASAIPNPVIHVTTDAPTRIAADAAFVGTETVAAGATFDALQGSASVSLEAAGTDEARLLYRAPTGLDVEADMASSSGDQTLYAAALTLEDAPSSLDITQPEEGIALDADAPVGLIDVAIASGRGIQGPGSLAEQSHVYRFDDGASLEAGLRLRDASQRQRANFDGTLDVSLSAQRSSLRIRMSHGGRMLDAAIPDAPVVTQIRYSPSDQVLSLMANADVEEMSIEVTDPAPMLGLATMVALRLEGVPSLCTIYFDRPGSDVAIYVAGGKTVGLVEYLASSGLPAPSGTQNMVEMHDLASSSYSFVRLHDVRSLEVSMGPSPKIDLDASIRSLQVNMSLETADGVERLQAAFSNVQPPLELELIPAIGGGELRSTVRLPGGSATINSTVGDRDIVGAALFPLPSSASLCWSTGNTCDTRTSNANGGTIRLSASSPTRVQLFDCRRPLTSCTLGPATDFIEIDLTGRVFQSSLHIISDESGRVALDSDGIGVFGDIRRFGSATLRDARVVMPSGFLANDRVVTWSPPAWPFLPVKVVRTGSISCPPGTLMTAQVPTVGVLVDFEQFVCP